MAYTIPTFNLICDLYTGPPGVIPPVGPARLTVLVNLSPGRRVMMPSAGFLVLMEVLLPAGTDIRGGMSATGSDIIELPQGSARYYKVLGVDDVAKGFANEYRIAWCAQQPPQPTPLP